MGAKGVGVTLSRSDLHHAASLISRNLRQLL